MRAPARPASNLVELHRIFLDLLRTEPGAARSHLTNQVVMHAAFQPRFRAALGTVMTHRAKDVNLRRDVRQGAISLLIERLTFDDLSYRDEGPNPFGGWLYKFCKSACADSWEVNRPFWLQSVPLQDSGPLENCPAPVEAENRFDMVLQAILMISDPLLREIMLQFATGVTLRDTASQHGLTISAIFRLRSKGILEVRRLLRAELADIR